MHVKKRLLALASAGLMAVGFAQPAAADTILVFGQSTIGNSITATNPTATSTALSGTNVPVTITAINAPLVTPLSALFTLNATSVGAATTTATNDLTQRFQGSFSLTQGATNYLSGTFSDAVFGAGTGLTLTVSSATPGESVTFTSNVITILGAPQSISLALTNVTPPIIVAGQVTLPAFTATVGGNMSAFAATPVPEPASLLLLGSGLAGIAARVRRRRSSAGIA